MDNKNTTIKKGLARFDRHTLWMLVLFVAIFVLASVINPKRFLTIGNFQSMSYQFPEYGIIAFGMMICMIAGGIDLSTVGVANLTAIVAACIMTRTGLEGGVVIVIAIVAALALGAGCGAINGFLIGYLRIPAMLVTLCGLQVYTGLGLAITKGPAITGIPESFQLIGNGLMFGLIPYSALLFVVIVILMWFLLKYTKYGQQLFMVGSNPEAARYSGINNLSIIIRTHMLSAVLAAVSGIIICAHYGSAKSDYGTSYTLLTLLIIILGGINPAGGKGKLGGVVIAILTLQVLSSLFNIQRLDSNFKTFVFGCVLAAVMVMEYWGELGLSKRRKT